MRNLSTGSRGILLAAAILFLVPSLTPAQTSNVQPRITAAIDEANLTTLRGNTHPLARPQYDRGPAPASLPMERMLLVLKRSAVSAGCGGGGGGRGGGGGGGVQNPGTSPGQYSVAIMVTINGVTQTVANLTLNVQ